MPKASKTKQTDRPESIVLTATKQTVADVLLNGATVTAAAKAAGITVGGACQVKKAKDVISYMGHSQKQLADALQIKRADIVVALMSVAEEAQRAVDYGSAVRAYTEVAKMLGLYAPEVKKVEISLTQRAIAHKYEAMSDEELLKIAEGEGNTIEGEYVRTH